MINKAKGHDAWKITTASMVMKAPVESHAVVREANPEAKSAKVTMYRLTPTTTGNRTRVRHHP
jgi:hypothetical protein